MRKVAPSMEDVDRMAESVSRASAFLKSPASPSRLPILCHLAEGGMSVSEFEDVLELRQQTLSQQLATLPEDALGKIILPTRIQGGHRAALRATPRGLGDDHRVDRPTRRMMPASSWATMLLLRCHLLQVGNQVGDLLFLLEAGEFHLIARDVTLRVGNVSRQRLLVPGDAGFLHGTGILEAFDAPCRPAEDTDESRANLVLFFIGNVTDLHLLNTLSPFSGSPWASAAICASVRASSAASWV